MVTRGFEATRSGTPVKVPLPWATFGIAVPAAGVTARAAPGPKTDNAAPIAPAEQSARRPRRARGAFRSCIMRACPAPRRGRASRGEGSAPGAGIPGPARKYGGRHRAPRASFELRIDGDSETDRDRLPGRERA